VTAERSDLAAYLQPEVTEGRLARQWASIQRKQPRAAQGGPTLLRLMAAGIPALALCAWMLWAQKTHPLSGAVLESSDTPVSVQLRDGSAIELAAQTQLRVLRDQAAAVEVEIASGRASFEVKHVPGRSFTVHAGAVGVHVVGTRFDVIKTVRREGTEIEVSVKRGIVEVDRADRDGDKHRLTVGERWSAWIPSDPASVVQLPAAVVSAASQTPAEPAAEPAPAPAPVTNTKVEPDAAPAPRAIGPDKRGEGVKALFLRANLARRAGRVGEAAGAYDELLHRFPRDTRAAVSAFELGRIRMDALSDPKGAAGAFAESLRLSHHAQFREDAMARLAVAQDAVGDFAGCRSTRNRYVAEYASGVHAAALSVLCGSP
jgi:TolA-binding protein